MLDLETNSQKKRKMLTSTQAESLPLMHATLVEAAFAITIRRKHWVACSTTGSRHGWTDNKRTQGPVSVCRDLKVTRRKFKEWKRHSAAYIDRLTGNLWEVRCRNTTKWKKVYFMFSYCLCFHELFDYTWLIQHTIRKSAVTHYWLIYNDWLTLSRNTTANPQITTHSHIWCSYFLDHWNYKSINLIMSK